MKHQWRKDEKNIYLPKGEPNIVNVPEFSYITISGKGNPNKMEFSENVEKLYTISYAIRMMPKSGVIPKGYEEYTVYPLEGLWDMSDEGKKREEFDKEELVYKIMIRQPQFVDDELFRKAVEISVKKKKNLSFNEVKFEKIHDGKSLQIMHTGSYDEEENSFSKMKRFLKENNLSLRTEIHREIYISDVRRVEESKRKTVLRYMIEG